MTIALHELFIWTSVGVLGLLFGSFVTMASYRIPLGQEIMVRRSHCTACNHTLAAWDLIPVVSWIIHRGKCAYCHHAVSARYPLIELIVAALFLLVYALYGISIISVVLSLTAVCLMIIIITDFEHYIIPDSMYIVLLPLGVAYSRMHQLPWLTIIASGMVGLLSGMALRWGVAAWKKKEGLGLGDVKFLGIVGCFLLPVTLPSFFFIAGVLGIITGFTWQALGKGKLFPFGPALATSLFLCLLIPENISLAMQLSRHL
jgi:leader peptidase (prepilin peptidase)/N-methyltransferase